MIQYRAHPWKSIGAFEIAAGPEIGGSHIIAQPIKSLAGRLSAESNVITLAITSRQQTQEEKRRNACKYIKNQKQVSRCIRALLRACEPLA